MYQYAEQEYQNQEVRQRDPRPGPADARVRRLGADPGRPGSCSRTPTTPRSDYLTAQLGVPAVPRPLRRASAGPRGGAGRSAARWPRCPPTPSGTRTYTKDARHGVPERRGGLRGHAAGAGSGRTPPTRMRTKLAEKEYLSADFYFRRKLYDSAIKYYGFVVGPLLRTRSTRPWPCWASTRQQGDRIRRPRRGGEEEAPGPVPRLRGRREGPGRRPRILTATACVGAQYYELSRVTRATYCLSI